MFILLARYLASREDKRLRDCGYISHGITNDLTIIYPFVLYYITVIDVNNLFSVFSVDYYKDNQILSCDSYLGIVIYVLSLILFVLIISSYGWIINNMITVISQDFKSSRRVQGVRSLQVVKDDEIRQFEVR